MLVRTGWAERHPTGDTGPGLFSVTRRAARSMLGLWRDHGWIGKRKLATGR